MLARVILAVLAFLAPPLWAAPQQPLKIGIFDHPPFAMKDAEGRWMGLAVDLWEHISAQLGLPYEYIETPHDEFLPRLARGELDLVLGEIGVSADRARVIEFTQPYLSSPAAAAVPRSSQRPAWKTVFQEMIRHGVVTVIFIMMGALAVFSFILWLIERKAERSHFGGKPIHGFGSAVWFAGVTMTTVGYGDKTPQTGFGRTLAFLWMFFGVLAVSAFTGTVASSITVSRLNAGLLRFSDLAHYRNGVLAGSLGQDVLSSIGVPALRYPSLEAGFDALQENRITAFIGDEVTLRYFSQQAYPEIFEVISLPTTRISFAMAARPGLRSLQEINVALIAETTHPLWQGHVERWLGPPPGK